MTLSTSRLKNPLVALLCKFVSKFLGVRLKKASLNLEGEVDNLIDFTFRFKLLPFLPSGFLIRPIQIRDEIRGLLELLKEKRPKLVMKLALLTGAPYSYSLR